MAELRLLTLYPEQMNIYADRGNVIFLERRCRWRGIGFAATTAGIGEGFDPDEHDLIYIGGGQDRDQVLVAEELRRQVPRIREALAQGAALLAVCGGYQLLGHRYAGHQGDEIRGTGLVDLETVAGETRIIGNVLVECRFDGVERTLVGFENHAGRTTLGAGVEPLGRVVAGGGNNGQDGTEGCRAGRVIGTYVHGPLLPKNPWLADALLAWALDRRGRPATLEPLDDHLEALAAERAAAIAVRERR